MESTTTSRDGKIPESGRNFIQQIIDRDLREGRVDGVVVTRFPPEPNGYLHIGHAKAICLNFGIAEEYSGQCHLRFDDTNPEKEDMEYVHAIERDIRWLGFDWGENRFFASDYFDQLFGFAIKLIKDGKAYVDSLSEEEIRTYRGTVTTPGMESPYRSRSVDENLQLFREMRKGAHPDGSHVLRAKIDMTSTNMLLRDPVLYRIKHADHYRRGNEYSIYPMYDFAHPLSDAIEGVTHSLCSLEFEVHRPLYDWLVDAVFSPPRPHQYEFARLNLDYTVTSKRKLLQLVDGGHVNGWDDPRMPSLAGFRRRGYSPEAIRAFCDMIGVAKADNRVDISMLEYAVRDDLNDRAPRVMCVLDPIRVVLTNFEEDRVEWIDAPYWPHDIPKKGTRPVPLTREILIERDDFMEKPTRRFHRLSPGAEVRLRYGYIIRCDEIVRNDDGTVVELRCTYDPETQSGSGPSVRRVKGTIHWVSATEGLPIEARLYDRLFSIANPDAAEDDRTFMDFLNPESLHRCRTAVVEPSVKEARPEDRFQFERLGYFIVDADTKSSDRLIVNRTITLRDTWGKVRERAETGDSTASPGSKQTPGPGSGPTPQENLARDPFAGLTDEQAAASRRLSAEYGLPVSDACIIAADDDLCDYFESVVQESAAANAAANWLIHEMRPALENRSFADPGIPPASLARLLQLLDQNTLSSSSAKVVLHEMLATGAAADEIVEQKGLQQVSDRDTLEPLVVDVIKEFSERADAYRSGKKGLMGFFTGQVMRRSGGKANPQLVQELIRQKLD